MEFEFDKFVKDIEKKQNNYNEQRNVQHHIIEQDRLRRLRDRQYHELWQNRIKWGTNEQSN